MSAPTLTDIPAEADARAAATGSLLRLATAGSVDDGKSTLVGRLLFDSKSVLRDQLAAVEQVSLDRGLTSADLALLTDGLRAEREQGITIDVAYRYFATPQRSFILADCPGHVQYTRNTVTGCSTADVVVLLVDARNGVLEQTRRHLAVAALLRVPHVIVAVNKIDLVDFSAEVYAAIEADIRAVAAELGVAAIHVLPTSALLGDNIVEASASTPFYAGPTLLGLLESLPTARDEGAFRLPVQLVIRPQGAAPAPELRDYRGYAGQIASGTVRVGDPVVALPSGRRSRVAGIDLGERSLEEAVEGQSVTVRLSDDVDVARGDTLAAAGDAPQVLTEVTARVSWLSEEPLRPRARVLLKHGALTVQAIVGTIEGRLDLDDLTTVPADSLELNDIGLVQLRLASPVPLADYSVSRSDGAFLLIDAHEGGTLGAGMVQLAGTGGSDPATAAPSGRG
ncbi:sulfate adenylyltransferase subunit 1 [Actinomyces sp. oral taxon 171]|uniref:sulfate adenylyltransferase subunit 1 n=1 Tax=Actinomyces sp. oral taxon 171 TaxID=706438 RepID=UPI0001F62A31|nr:GTP-binding protein [Actinomyces sp. oral taxon 171]EFW25466.1 putative translation elongation factor Tu [Actinomyces sp. oral taxon 171 str. F0337]QCT33536.1 sulfate adenylyltransferase [Actinomyces sp. oral taxon 171 str. F0337]